MPSWFDIRYLAGQSEGERECPIEAQESSDMIAEIIESEHKKGIPYIGLSWWDSVKVVRCRSTPVVDSPIELPAWSVFRVTCYSQNSVFNRLQMPIERRQFCCVMAFEMTWFRSMPANKSVAYLREHGWSVEFESIRCSMKFACPKSIVLVIS